MSDGSVVKAMSNWTSSLPPPIIPFKLVTSLVDKEAAEIMHLGIFFDVVTESSSANIPLNRWEGPRFLVGGLALLDNKNVVRIEEVDYKGSFLLRSMVSGDIIAYDAPLKRLRPLERYGVSIYDLARVPAELERIKCAWQYTLKTNNPHLFTVLKEQIAASQLRYSQNSRP